MSAPGESDPLGLYGGSGKAFELMARMPALTADEIHKAVLSLFKDEPLSRVATSDPADPGGILLEVFSLLHWNVLGFLEQQGRGLVEATLSLAGLTRRPAWPAAAVFQTTKGDLDPNQTTLRRSRPVEQGTALVFTPAWASYTHEQNGNGNRSWTVGPGRPIDFFVALGDSPDETALDRALKAVHEGIWQFGKTRVLPASPLDDLEGSGMDWVALAGSFAAQDSADGRTRAIAFTGRQFLRFTPPRGVETPLKLSFTGTLPDKVELKPNCALWLNLIPPLSGGAAPDFPGAIVPPAGESLGASGNMSAPDPTKETWEGTSETARLTAAVGGRDVETETDFLRRGPFVLRMRGTPTTAGDWERLFMNLDPGGRIRQARARESHFADGGAAISGIDLGFCCHGGPCESSAVASALAGRLLERAQVFRPLGTMIRVFYPKLTRTWLRVQEAGGGTWYPERHDAVKMGTRPPEEFYWKAAFARFSTDARSQQPLPLSLADEYIRKVRTWVPEDKALLIEAVAEGTDSAIEGWGLSWEEAEARR